ncbi:MAG: alpha-glucosidase [Treponema sp.]|jgi:oligo-1,6-glucosidase|nr:alpha-glucosidase [Treponema sp.]
MRPVNKKWWQERVVYQIYPRSFQDSPAPDGGPGDGIGDIPGIISRLGDIKALGIGIIWLSPVYPSPDADNGYDIADYRNIDPRYGTLADMDRLIAGAGKLDIRIIMDLVINHTSDEHEWFQKSRDRDSPYRDYYIWKPPKGRGPRGSKKDLPNNWMSFFMEDAWTFDEKSGEYYLHLFHRKQPDLNYRNPKVIEEVKEILRFWLDRGIAGFRCDVINVLYKSSFADAKKGPLPGMEFYVCQEENHEILRELRRDVLDKYDCFTVGETVMVDLERAKLLCDESRKELDMLFYFEHLQVDRLIERYIPKGFRPAKLLEVLSKWQRSLEWNAVYLENHDQSRIVSHYGDGGGAYWEASAKLLAVMELTMRGTPFIYQGQEIGMTNFDFKGFGEVNDVETLNWNRLLKRFHVPAWLRWKWLKESSRDNARTPVQWSGEANAGFTTGKPWLGINGNYTKINYASQRGDSNSVLAFYKKLIGLRAENDVLKYGEFRPLGARGKVIAWQRVLDDETWTVLLNFSGRAASAGSLLSGAAGGGIVVSNTGRTAMTKTLLPYEAVVLKNR